MFVAKNVRVMNKEQILKASSELEYNISQEAIAREDYYKLLDVVAEEDMQKIKDIISDEINHSIILMKLVEKYSGILPSEFENLMNLKKRG